MKKGVVKKLLLCAFVICFATIGIGATKFSKVYENATQLMVDGDYAGAAELFDSIANYEDSINLSMYCKANLLAQQGKYDEAISAFEFFGDYKDCKYLVVYYSACRIEEEAAEDPIKYLDAAEKFRTISLFRDSSARADGCRQKLYDVADNLLKQDSYEAALSFFTALEGYSDSVTRIKECIYRYGQDFMKEKHFDLAVEAFSYADDYADSADQLLLAQKLLNLKADHKFSLLNKGYNTVQEYDAEFYLDDVSDSLFDYYALVITNQAAEKLNFRVSCEIDGAGIAWEETELDAGITAYFSITSTKNPDCFLQGDHSCKWYIDDMEVLNDSYIVYPGLSEERKKLISTEFDITDTDNTEIDLSSMSADQIHEVIPVLRCMNNLRMIHLGSEGNGLGWDSIAAIHDAAPKAALDYNFSIWGVDTNLSTDYLSFSHIRMNDQGAEVRKVLPYMTRLQTLDMDTTDVSNENMAAIRDENPNVNVIWRVNFAGYSVRTDAERILASSTMRGGTVTNEEAAKLQYCTKTKYLDLGHNNAITDISFARSMPDLEVLILAINDISDISPLADCHKLEYLEINSTNVTDLTPLANLTSLRHLNIGRTAKSDTNNGEDLKRPRVTDITPLYGLSGLERLWIGSLTASGIPEEQIAYMKELMHELPPDPNDKYADNQKVDVISSDPSQGSWCFDEHVDSSKWDFFMKYGYFRYDYMPRYALLREQFQYDLGDAAYSLPQNDPLY